MIRAARSLAALLALLYAAPLVTAADRTFPALSGRVVDAANILSGDERAALESKLAALQSRSGVQLIVASVASLGGQEIEPFANALFRAWKLGDAKKNDGVLLLIAPNEHRVRIEVGYGLEGTLTDATSKVIIANVAPRFKAGDFNGGVARGVDDIIAALTTDAADWQKPPDIRTIQAGQPDIRMIHAVQRAARLIWIVPILFLAIFVFIFRVATRHKHASGWRGSRDGGSSSGGGSSDSGVSGGGGSSGGGGASGSW